MAREPIKYARNGDVSLAYDVFGDGGRDIVFVPGFCSHLDILRGEPAYHRFMTRLAESCRIVRYDKRNTGLSDRLSEPATIDDAVADLRAVIHNSGVKKPVLLGFSEGGALASVYAATYPDELSGLVLCEAFARARPGPGYLEGMQEELSALTDRIFGLADNWGEGRLVEFFGPSMVGGSVHRRLVGLFERAAATPATIRATFEAALDLDVSDVLPTIRVPTVVMHREHDIIPIEAGRYIASQIPGAQFVQLHGGDHMPWAGDFNEVASAIERFVTAEARGVETDVSLSTLAMTGIVDADGLTARLGDRGFAEFMIRHDRALRRELQVAGGIEIKHTGAGLLTSFDAPTGAARFGLAAVAAAATVGADIRIGVHTGEVRLVAGELGGASVHVVARILGEAAPGEVLVSSTVRDLSVASGLTFESHGLHSLRGVPGEWELFRAIGDPKRDLERLDPWDGFKPGERRLLENSGRTPRASRVLSRVIRRIP